MSTCFGTVLISKSGFEGAFVSCTVEQRQNSVSSKRRLISAGTELGLDSACSWLPPNESNTVVLTYLSRKMQFQPQLEFQMLSSIGT